ncbi:hypothetical protein ZWY2020_014221 [Hordeum vulgare]|nr:hypothetical protein ZWY2020_014221 [Hordeum vulgare]
MPSFTVPPVVTFVLLLILASTATACTEHDKHSLLGFLAELSRDGGLAMSWRDNGTDCCEWEGITCNEDGAVTKVSLGSKGLEGRISPSLADLTSLLHVNLSYNSFFGGLPRERMSSGSTIVLDVSFSRLNGPLPELPSLVTTDRPLQVLNISSNQLGSEFPSATWKMMKNLIALNASNNSFTGYMPSSLCIGSPSLTLLDLCYNQLSGDIPTTLGDCSKLKVLKLFLLLFLASPTTACTDEEKRNLLQFLAGLSRDGGLATSWRNNGTDCCKWEGISCNGDGAVTGVSLESKGLEGPISPFLANLTSLLCVNLSHNSFSGGLPAELMFSRSIIVLDVSFSRLNGLLPELPSLVTTDRPLQVLNISSNQFGSEFPSATWKVMKNLIALNASNNSFTGHIPSSLCIGSPSLALLDLCYNQLSGDIPNTLGNCSKLKVLKAGNNHLTGILPVEIFHTTSLEYLSFPNNGGLQGELNGAHIVKLSMIPQEIGQLKALLYLNLSSNNFYGEIPQSIGNLTNLQSICLETTTEPVVTLCGHLYCWPCIFLWFTTSSTSSDDEILVKAQTIRQGSTHLRISLALSIYEPDLRTSRISIALFISERLEEPDGDNILAAGPHTMHGLHHIVLHPEFLASTHPSPTPLAATASSRQVQQPFRTSHLCAFFSHHSATLRSSSLAAYHGNGFPFPCMFRQSLV